MLGDGGINNARISMERETQSESGNDCWSKNVADTVCDRPQGFGQDGSVEGQTGLCGGEGCDQEQRLHMANTENQGNVWRVGSMGATQSQYNDRGSQSYGSRQWWEVEPNVGRVANGVAARVDRLKAIGNGQVPLCAATAWRLLT